MQRDDVDCEKMTAKKRCQRYEISFGTYRHWIDIYDSGRVFHDDAGHPYEIDEIEDLDITEKLLMNTQLKSTPVPRNVAQSSGKPAFNKKKRL
jgi:hypothetical protein